MTNGDRVRSMSDEELLALFCMLDSTLAIPHGVCCETFWAVSHNRAWLKEDVNSNSQVWDNFKKVKGYVDKQREDSKHLDRM